MISHSELIQDLTLILIAAGIATVLFKKLNQPVVLGYILVGFIVSPHTPLLPTIHDEKGIHVWAEIGVIFLLFALGLEFNLKKLVQIGGSASVTAVTEVLIMTGIGFIVGDFLSWSMIDSLFLGGILAISSTTIIIKAFEETGVKDRQFAKLVFGVLIVEDLVAVLLLVFLSTLAISRQFEGDQLLISIGQLGFFLSICFLMGIFFVPTLFKKIKRHINEETLLIISLGFCFFMVSLATSVGFSPALGAFLMGCILAETTESHNIEHLVKPVKDLFAAIFFVSVGILINPKLLIEYIEPIILITLATIIGKITSTTFGALISGKSLRLALQTGLSLAQIGEFSFIIASLGQTLKVTSDFLFPVAVGVSVITTLLTPYLIKSSDSICNIIEKIIPNVLKKYLENYQNQTRIISIVPKWFQYTKKLSLLIFICSITIIAIFVLLENILLPTLMLIPKYSTYAKTITLFVAFLISAPFFWAINFSKINISIKNILTNQAPLQVIRILRYLISISLFIILSKQFISIGATLLIVIVFILAIFILFYKRIKIIYLRIEKRFIKNLNEKSGKSEKDNLTIAPWNAHITKIEVSPNSSFLGKSILDMQVREKFGVTIAMLERGNKKIFSPGANELIFPYDILSLIGDDEQIHKFNESIAPQKNLNTDFEDNNEYSLQQLLIQDNSIFCNKSILESGFKDKTYGLIVGIERNGQRILNPPPSTFLEANDIIWIFANNANIQKIFPK